MKNKVALLSFAQRCRNILASNWEGHLHTIKADAKGSKGEIHTSKVHYMFHKGHPLLLVPEGDFHNTNTIIDERGSLSICSNVPGQLMALLRSLKKLPARVALTGDVMLVNDKKVQTVIDSLNKSVLREHEIASRFGHSVSAILTSAGPNCKSRSEGLQNILNQIHLYNLYKFDIGSCAYIDGSGGTHDVDLEDLEEPKSELLLPFAAKLIDGINQSQIRRRALMLFCLEYFNAIARIFFTHSLTYLGIITSSSIQATLDGESKLLPMNLTSRHFDLMVESGAPFARSFGEDGYQVLDRIDRELLRRKRDRFAPGGWCMGSTLFGRDPCSVYSNSFIIRPTDRSKKLEKLLIRLLDPDSFRSRQCK